MILSNNAFNWAMLRSGMGIGEFMASLTPEREEELLKQYNEWRRKRGLPEEPIPVPAPMLSSDTQTQRDETTASDDTLSDLFNEVAAEVEEEEAEEAALVHNALDGADEIVEEAERVPDEIVGEVSVITGVDEAIAEDAMPEAVATPVAPAEAAVPEVVTTPAVPNEAAAPEVMTTQTVAFEALGAEPASEQRVDFTAVIRSLPKEADPALYSRIKGEYGNQTIPMTKAALQEATKRHKGTAAIRAFLAWLEQE